MAVVVQANNTYSRIETLVRRLTASYSQAALASSEIQQLTNTFYNSDFPYGIKLDQMRSVYTFYTRPYIDRYPLDVNYNQGVREPVYIDGIQGNLFKDRQQFYNMWPRWPTKFQEAPSTRQGTITNITNFSPGQVTSAAHGLANGDYVTINGVGGMTQVNGNTYVIAVVNANAFNINVDTSLFGVYTSGGSWTSINRTMSFTIPGPFLSKEVVMGGVDINGSAVSIADNGNSVLQTQQPAPVVSVPLQDANPPFPGMYNVNTNNPGLLTVRNIGTVDYVTGVIAFTLSAPLAPGTILTIRVVQYQTGRPYSLLFWNNEFSIRPIPKHIHKVEVEAYLTPVQFMLTTDSPILNQWCQYIAYGVACERLRQLQDMEGVSNLMEGMKRQEALVLERQGIEEIGQRNTTIFSGTQQQIGGNFGWNQGFY